MPLILLDPAPDSPENLLVARIVATAGAEDFPMTLTRATEGEHPSAQWRARAAGAASLTIVIQYRRKKPRVVVDIRRPASATIGALLADLLETHIEDWIEHEVFGYRDRTAHRRPVVVVGPLLGTPVWRVAAAILQGLERAHA